MRITLEIAATTPDEAVAAVRAGADRLELCAGLEVGGLTPSPGLLARVRELVTVPVYAMLRPRPGGFAYSADEWDVMVRDAEAFLAAGADGLVFGALDEHGHIADGPCRKLVEVAHGRAVFHRAFDFLLHAHHGLEQLIDLGFERVLTSGGRPTAREGAARLATLVARAAGRIDVVAAGGIRPENVAELVRATGCTQVHAAARGGVPDPTLLANLDLAQAMGADNLSHITTTDPALVARLRATLDQLPA